MSRWNIDDTDFPAIRRVMGPARERLDDEELEQVLERVFPGSDPEEVENFMQTAQRFGKQAAPIIQKVGPGMAQGAVKGAAVGGPWGLLAGAALGGAGSMMGGGGPAGSQAPAAVPLASAPSPGATPGVAPPSVMPGAGSAVAPAQLLAILSRPETLQALLALVMAQLGRTTVTLGNHEVPATAFADAIAELAAETAQVTRSVANGSSYWFDDHGAPRCDVANPASRAALLWSDLVEAAEDEEDEDVEETDEEEDAFDALMEAIEWDEESPLASFEAALYGRSAR